MRVAKSHRRMVLSLDPDKTQRLFGEKATELTALLCPLKTASSLPAATSQIRRFPSWPAETALVPSGENAKALTALLCPAHAANSLPVAASQNFTSPSSLPERAFLPSGENATALTALP